MTIKKELLGLRDLESKYGPLTLARFIVAWRLAAGLSQKKLAAKLGISPANLCDIEKGRKGVSLFKAAEIAAAIGYSPAVLVQLALQEQLASAGLRYTVEVKSRAA